MLTRLKVNGFKNLVDVDVRFGPFTCIAGVNGSGKSNLFDAIRFLAALAEKPLVEAALSVRGEGGRSSDIRSLFHRVGDEYAKEMSFEAEMIIPAEGVDDLGQPIKPSATFLGYSLTLAYRGYGGAWPSTPLQIIHEELSTIPGHGSKSSPGFSYEGDWYTSAIRADDDRAQTIFSVRNGQSVTFRLGPPPHSGEGEQAPLNTAIFPQTILSSQSVGPIASDPRVMLARQEMNSWRVLQLDPAAMRRTDDLSVPAHLRSDGSGLAATLYRLAHMPPRNGRDPYVAETAIYARVAGRLFDLIGDVSEIRVDRDDKREELTLLLTGRDGTTHSARGLSDGMLRFLALAVLLEDEAPGVYCIEEPENGIHPGRIPALIRLLQDIAVDTSYSIEDGNPLRQVIITTHSPSVVKQVPDDCLVVSELVETRKDGRRFKRASFSGLTNTWREVKSRYGNVSLNTLLTYLNPEEFEPPVVETAGRTRLPGSPRVMDRPDSRSLLGPLDLDE